MVYRVDSNLNKYKNAVVWVDLHISDDGSRRPVDIDSEVRLCSPCQCDRRNIDTSVVVVVDFDIAGGRSHLDKNRVEKQ